MAKNRLAFALDYPTLTAAQQGAQLVAPHVGVLKVGLELFIREGRAALQMASSLGCQVFLDLKLHDIEKTVERAVANAAQLGARYLTVHCAGGPGMLTAAAERAQKENPELTLLGITVLTSLGAQDLQTIGVTESPAEHASRLARLARDCGLGGVVCSTEEVAQLRSQLGPDFVLVTPGIRLASAGTTDDQKRVGTPAQAIRSGSSLLVVGRPIRDAQDPAQAAAAIVAEIDSALI